MPRHSSPALRAGEEKRRSTEVGINRRNLIAWLLHQQLSDEPDSTDTVQSTSRAEEILQLLPHLGSPTTLIFLSMERIRPSSNDWDRLFARVRAALRDEDAVLRLDDTTLVVLTAPVEPTLTPSLLTRISWRLWPADLARQEKVNNLRFPMTLSGPARRILVVAAVSSTRLVTSMRWAASMRRSTGRWTMTFG